VVEGDQLREAHRPHRQLAIILGLDKWNISRRSVEAAGWKKMEIREFIPSNNVIFLVMDHSIAG
jgi:ketol-acid reductoisomerase